MNKEEKQNLVYQILSKYGDISKTACSNLSKIEGLIDIINQDLFSEYVKFWISSIDSLQTLKLYDNLANYSNYFSK